MKKSWKFKKHHSEETKKRISDSEKGKIVSLETRIKMSISQKGKQNWWQGKKHSQLTKDKISKANKERYKNGLSIEHKKKIKENHLRGKKCHLWKGGISPLCQQIRSLLEYKQWIKKILERDNYTCQLCYQKGGKLNAHHKKLFSLILQEFLQTYSQFSPIEDKETLVRLAISYEPFWNVNNGITFCKKCHQKNKSIPDMFLNKKGDKI